MTTLAVDAPDTALVVSTPAPTQIVAALDPPLVLEVAPIGASLVVTVARPGVLTAPAAQGPGGPPGKDGRDGVDGGNLTYSYPFPAPLAVWSIAHNLGRFPSVTALDTAGDQVFGDLSYLDANTLQVAFTVALAGVAYLN